MQETQMTNQHRYVNGLTLWLSVTRQSNVFAKRCDKGADKTNLILRSYVPLREMIKQYIAPLYFNRNVPEHLVYASVSCIFENILLRYFREHFIITASLLLIKDTFI